MIESLPTEETLIVSRLCRAPQFEIVILRIIKVQQTFTAGEQRSQQKDKNLHFLFVKDEKST